jgi:hypothetical protein
VTDSYIFSLVFEKLQDLQRRQQVFYADLFNPAILYGEAIGY